MLKKSISLFVLLNAMISYSDADQHEKVFTSIYNNAIWGKNSEGVGFSGGGSLLNNCGEYIKILENFIVSHDIQSIVDAGCGDWEFSRYVNWHNASYIGYDVVKSVIDKNNARYANDSITFRYGNLVEDELPAADLLLCKHVLQHLPNGDIVKFLEQVHKYKYCIFVNEVLPQTLSSDGADIAIGGGHKIDLGKPPFNLKAIQKINYKIGNAVHQIFIVDNTK